MQWSRTSSGVFYPPEILFETFLGSTGTLVLWVLILWPSWRQSLFMLKRWISGRRSLSPPPDWSTSHPRYTLGTCSRCMTALECVRCGLGPHSLDIANYFIDHGIPFLTLNYLWPSSQGKHNSLPVNGILGQRLKGYTFNLADYAAYTTIWDSYLLLHPNCYGLQ